MLRQWHEGDRDAYVSIRTDPHVGVYIPGHPMTSEMANEWFDRTLERGSEPSDGIMTAIIRRDTAQIAGTAGIFMRSIEHRQAELGYILLPSHGGQGFATEAAAALLDAAFEDLGSFRVFAELDPRNAPSARVCERLGMRLEGHLVGTYLEDDVASDSYVYAILESEWREQRRSR